MAETRVELPDGHLVNLSPRPTRDSPYKAYRAEYRGCATELAATPPPRYASQTRTPEYGVSRCASGNMSQAPRTTKLPVPRNVTESRKTELRETPSPTGIPKPTTPSQFGPTGDHPRSSGKDRDQYWSKIREKFEKDSPLSRRSARNKDNGNDESPNPRMSYHRTRPPTASRQDHNSPCGATARTGIPSPSTAKSSPAQGHRNDTCHPSDTNDKWRKQGDQWINSESAENTPHKSEQTDTTAESSPRSHPSISPVSAEDSSITDWEDRFVVNMPTAKDPNPPTMTSQQISEYQKSIERVYQDGGKMADPDALPSCHASPESKISPRSHRAKSPREFKPYKAGYDGAYDDRPKLETRRYEPQQPSQHPHQMQPQLQQEQEQEPQPLSASQRQAAAHYYSPDEIGGNRISTIWEESPTKTKEKRHPQNADGSFLGCREISGEKNPDEILMFAPTDDASLHPRPLTLASKKKQKDTKRVTAQHTMKSVEETVILKEEQPQNSQSSKHVQCSKSSTTCQSRSCLQHPIPRTGSQDSGKENKLPSYNSPEEPARLEDGRREDDVFIITPTITRTMIPTPDKKPSAPKPQGLRRPGGTSHTVTAEAIKAVRAKAQMISTPSGLRPGVPIPKDELRAPTLTTSQTLPAGSITSTKDKEEADRAQERATGTASNSIRGFIRTGGLARSTGIVRSPTDSLASILRSSTESLRNRAESLRNGSGSSKGLNGKQSVTPEPTLPSRDNSESSRSARSFQSAKETHATSGKVTPPPQKSAAQAPPEKKIPPTKPIAVASSKPAAKKPTLSEDPLSEKTDKTDKTETKERTEKPVPSVKKISALAKPSKLDKPSRSVKVTASEKKSPPPAPKKVDPPKKGEKKVERVKPQPRIRTSGSVLEIAELDGLQVASPNQTLQSNITNVYADLGDMHNRDEDDPPNQGSSPLALSLVFDIIVVAVTQVSRTFRMGTDSPYSKFVVANIMNMTRHCYRVFKCIYAAFSRYQSTGAWPKARNDQAISRFMLELLQAIVYLFILGFAAMVIGRAASYVVLVSSWIVWFARPFAWAFQCVGRALIM
ncbi:hypothetical protein PENANT_c051G05589 [Penicillium antarcticum]|uniref:NTP binding protein n=1 Tax=Penicillium antarcticum TaxID=416450 RepID=A0A1V6PSE4_9EURO|nr:uncharacterized protein N7508_000286 [Penicillium antarcticum]KAJ5320003.1 hypothetical protein N7508_000286 [Penicillium antarcticum]OQD79426.1 hypothetical protein PENANT_c051G05589 [Penicillium antarcticum]